MTATQMEVAPEVKTLKAIRAAQAKHLKERKAQFEDRWDRIKRLEEYPGKALYWMPKEVPTKAEDRAEALLAAIECKEGLLGKEIQPVGLAEVEAELTRLLKQVKISLGEQEASAGTIH